MFKLIFIPYIYLMMSLPVLSASDGGEREREASPGEIDKVTRSARGSNFKHAVKSFPVESLYFYSAQGLILASTMLTTLNTNPTAIEEYLNQGTDPVGNLSFFAFVLANRNVGVRLGRLLEQRLYVDSKGKTRVKKALIDPTSKMGGAFARLNGFIGMGAGMFASHMVSNILHDPNLKKCAIEILYRKPKDFCDMAYRDWVTHGKIRRLLPDLVTIFSASILGGMSFEAARGLSAVALARIEKKKYYSKVKDFFIKGLKIPLGAMKAGVGAHFGKIGHFTFFLLADELMRKELNGPLQRVIYHGHLGTGFSDKKYSFGILSDLQKKIKNKREQQYFIKSLLLEEYSFEKRKYFAAQAMELDSLFYAWTDKVINIQSGYAQGSSFYAKLYRYLYQKEGFNPLNAQNVLYRVDWDYRDQEILAAWNIETQFAFLGANEVDRVQINQLCLNPEFYHEKSPLKKAVCLRQRELKWQHLKKLALSLDGERQKFSRDRYTPSIKRQKLKLLDIKKAFSEKNEKSLSRALTFINNINHQIHFAKKHGSLSHFETFFWESLQQKIVGFRPYTTFDALKFTRTNIVNYLISPLEKRGIIGVEKNNFELKKFSPAVPLEAGVSFIKWFAFDPEIASHFEEYQKSFPRDKFSFPVESIDEYFLAEMTCGKFGEKKNYVRNLDGFKTMIDYPRIVEFKGAFCQQRKMNLALYFKMVAKIKKDALFRRYVEKQFDKIDREIFVASSQIEKDFIESFVTEEFPKMYSGKGILGYVTGTKTFQETLLEDVKFYLDIMPRDNGRPLDLPDPRKDDFFQQVKNFLTFKNGQCNNSMDFEEGLRKILSSLGGDHEVLLESMAVIVATAHSEREDDKAHFISENEQRAFQKELAGQKAALWFDQKIKMVLKPLNLTTLAENLFMEKWNLLFSSENNISLEQYTRMRKVMKNYTESLFYMMIQKSPVEFATIISQGIKDSVSLGNNYCEKFKQMKEI